MCSTQLSMFSDDLPENKDTKNNITKKEPQEKKKSPELKIPVIKKQISHENLTEEDNQVLKIEEQYKAVDSLSNEQIVEYTEQIKDIALTCTKCDLSKTRTKVVFSDGLPTAPIMLIGEGPGENEDLTGVPFVGRAGQLLDRILASGGISRENDVYISNVVKCRPPKNRTPYDNEVEACSIYLRNQIELTQASIILLTGATAMIAILGQSQPITKVRGSWIEQNGKWIMPIFHPSYLLRNPSKEVGSPKWLMWQDIKKIKQKLDELKGK